LFAGLGHKSDLLVIHFRRTMDELGEAQRELARLELGDYLEQTTSYLSVIEIGLYEASVALYARLAEQGLSVRSPQWQQAVADELAAQHHKMAARLFPKIPARRHLCFYPMDKKREGADNWYRLPIDERRRLMHDHGLVGRRFAGEVTQIISGSIGLDDWEWGVDLFSDDPLVFKRLVYEMRFDEASASYAKFGPFYVGIRTEPVELAKLLAV
jgi:peroxiredoxin